MRLLILGTFLPTYPRHRIIAEGLRLTGVDVTLRTLPYGASLPSRVGLLLGALGDLRRFDALLIPAFNQTFAPLVWAAARAARVPVLLDYMIGLTDLNEDRKTASGTRARLYRQIDRFNLRAIPAITDTRAHIDAFERLLGVHPSRMQVLPVGVQPEWLEAAPPPLAAPLTAIFIGTFIPFQGVEVIVEAAALLRDDPRIRIELIGSGQTFAQTGALVQKLALPNLSLTPGFFPIPTLTQRAACAAVILGVFGAAEKTGYVVPNKVFDGMAMGRAVITAESPALREFFTPGEHFIPVPAGRPDALAAALTAAADDPRRALTVGAAAQQRIRAAFLPQHIGAQLRAMLEALVKSSAPPPR